jgi:hypothetical protein
VWSNHLLDIAPIEDSLVPIADKGTTERREPSLDIITIEYDESKPRSPKDGTAHGDGNFVKRPDYDPTLTWILELGTIQKNKIKSRQSGIAMGNNVVDSVDKVNSAINSENKVKPRQNGIAMGNNAVDSIGNVDGAENKVKSRQSGIAHGNNEGPNARNLSS